MLPVFTDEWLADPVTRSSPRIFVHVLRQYFFVVLEIIFIVLYGIRVESA